MYKTVRHGENSLQYKILAQQEEGLTSVKYKKYRRSRTTGIIAVILLLICGVVASAVLVPLILTNDFITLTGTFQKFSVSTLRRTHSGNHIVVIAKKPHGWNSSRQSVLPPAKPANASVSHTKNVVMTDRNDSSSSFTTSAQPEPHEKELKQTTARQSSEDWDDSFVKQKLTNPTTSTEIHKVGLEVTEGKSLLSPVKPQQNLDKEGSLVASTSTAEISVDYQRQKWDFKTPTALINWSKNGLLSHPLSSVLGALFVINCFVIIIVVLMKRLQRRKIIKEKESRESTEDKARLLKPSNKGASDEE